MIKYMVSTCQFVLYVSNMPRFTPAIVLAKTTRERNHSTQEDGFVNRLINYLSSIVSTASRSLNHPMLVSSVKKSASTTGATKLKVQKHVGPLTRFSSVMVEQLEHWEEEEREIREQRYRDLEQAFRMFDTDNSGSISEKELRSILCSLGHNPTNQQIHDLMLQV
jgi:hypothetical protein